MRSSPFDSAVAGECVLITETGMEPLELLGRVGSTSFVIADSRRPFFPESLNPYELMAAALGSCTAMILRLHANQMGLALSRIRSQCVASLWLSRNHGALRTNDFLGGFHKRGR